MLRLESVHYLYLLLLIPFIVALYYHVKARHKRRLELFGNLETIKPLMEDASWFNVKIKFIFFGTVIALLSLVMARPQIGSKLKEVKKKGAEIMVVVDVSNSMLAEDIAPSRIEKTKFALRNLTRSLSDDRLGLIVFASDAFVQLPITSDFISAQNFIDYISPGMIANQGTNIGKALDLASRSFSSQSDKSQAIILISDGEDHEEGALSIAEKLGKKGIKVHVIGIGSPNGAPITIDGVQVKDENGNMVVSKLGEQMLSQIALSSGGSYIRATNQSLGLEQIVKQIRDLDEKEFSSMVFDEYNEQFPYILSIAIVLLLIEFLILERKNRILSRITIFNKR